MRTSRVEIRTASYTYRVYTGAPRPLQEPVCVRARSVGLAMCRALKKGDLLFSGEFKGKSATCAMRTTVWGPACQVPAGSAGEREIRTGQADRPGLLFMASLPH